MMKQNRLISIITMISISFVLLFTSCVGDNLHPTDPTENDMTPTERLGILMPTLSYLMHNSQENTNQHIEQMVANQYGGYMVTTNNWDGTNFGTFNPPMAWIEEPFSKMFVGFYSNFQEIIDVTERKGHFYAWASIIRVAVMLKVTDAYGPIPYSKMGYGISEVEYDNVQDVYHYMIEDLDKSIIALTAYLNEASSAQSSIGDYDMIYNGDFRKWIKFANSLKLRMAVRIATVDTEYAKEVMNSAISENGGPIEVNTDNAFLPTNDNPYSKAAYDWNDLAVSAVLSAYMNGFEDPRRSAYMSEVSGVGYRGVRLGIANINKNRYSDKTVFSKPAFNEKSPLLVYCAAETAFLKAEASLKGWISGGESQAKTYYEEGIRLSMEQHGASIGSYLSKTTTPEEYTDPVTRLSVKVANPITVSWDDAGASQNTKLEKIITQKWLANYPLGFESWCDHRRTGYPQFFPAQNNLSSGSLMGSITNSSSRMARRLPYPQIEYSGNNVNVQKAVMMLGGVDNGSVDLWWAKRP